MKKMFENIMEAINACLTHVAWKVVERPLHHGQKKILTGGVWIDENNNLYNCTGKCVGTIQWNEGFGA